MNERNKIKVVNSKEVSVMRYGTGILKCNTDELKKLRQKDQKVYDDNAWNSKKTTWDGMSGIQLCHWFKVWKLLKQQNITRQWVRRNSNRVGWGKRRNYGKTKECMDRM